MPIAEADQTLMNALRTATWTCLGYQAESFGLVVSVPFVLQKAVIGDAD